MLEPPTRTQGSKHYSLPLKCSCTFVCHWGFHTWGSRRASKMQRTFEKCKSTITYRIYFIFKVYMRRSMSIYFMLTLFLFCRFSQSKKWPKHIALEDPTQWTHRNHSWQRHGFELSPSQFSVSVVMPACAISTGLGHVCTDFCAS